uniref:glutathione transferase n=1 Tax=Acrobeloides nanus TaxID=290746 RepID=A0A914EFF2_9BILA
MVHYKLHYFDVRGLGEMIRMILIYNNEPFEEHKFPVDSEEWYAYKPSTPFGKVPLLEIDDKILSQSFAIARYLARKYGLAGKDDFESAYLDSIADAQKDFYQEVKPYYLVCGYGGKYGGDKDKEKLYNELFLPVAQRHLPKIEKLLKESKSGFYAQSGLSWVDFYMAEQTQTFSAFAPETFKQYPELLKHKERVYSLPQLSNYIQSRKNTPT